MANTPKIRAIWRNSSNRKQTRPSERLLSFFSDLDLEAAKPLHPQDPPYTEERHKHSLRPSKYLESSSNIDSFNFPEPFSDSSCHLDLDHDLEAVYHIIDPPSAFLSSPSDEEYILLPRPAALNQHQYLHHIPSTSSLTPSEKSLLRPTTFWRFFLEYTGKFLGWVVDVDGGRRTGLYSVGRGRGRVVGVGARRSSWERRGTGISVGDGEA